MFFSRPKEEKFIILDVQSGLVHGALVSKGEHGSRILSTATKSNHNKTQITSGAQLTKKVLHLTSEVLEQLQKISNIHEVRSVHFILSSPWISSKLKTIKAEYQKETEITHELLNGLIQEETKRQSQGAQLGDTTPLEQKIFEVRLNGYPSTTFEGKRAHALELSLSTSVGSRAFLDQLHAVTRNYVHHARFFHHSALLMQYTALRGIIHDKSEYLYVHVHSELTDIIAIKNGLCRHIGSFPMGIATIIRKIAQASGQSWETSDSFLSLFQGNKLNEADTAAAKKTIDPLLESWSKDLMKSLRESFDDIHIPRTLYLSAHSHFGIFKNSMAQDTGMTTFDIVSYEESDMIKMYTLALDIML